MQRISPFLWFDGARPMSAAPEGLRSLSFAATLGSRTERPIGVDAPEITARFRDPAGNVLGVYEERAAKGRS